MQPHSIQQHWTVSLNTPIHTHKQTQPMPEHNSLNKPSASPSSPPSITLRVDHTNRNTRNYAATIRRIHTKHNRYHRARRAFGLCGRQPQQIPGGVGARRHPNDSVHPSQCDLAEFAHQPHVQRSPFVVSAHTRRGGNGSRLVHVPSEHRSDALATGLPASGRWVLATVIGVCAHMCNHWIRRHSECSTSDLGGRVI